MTLILRGSGGGGDGGREHNGREAVEGNGRACVRVRKVGRCGARLMVRRASTSLDADSNLRTVRPPRSFDSCCNDALPATTFAGPAARRRAGAHPRLAIDRPRDPTWTTTRHSFLYFLYQSFYSHPFNPVNNQQTLFLSNFHPLTFFFKFLFWVFF